MFDELVADLWRAPGDVDQQGNVDRAFVHAELEEHLVFPHLVAVVRGPDDDGVLPDAEPLQGVEDHPAIAVHQGDHPVVAREDLPDFDLGEVGPLAPLVQDVLVGRRGIRGCLGWKRDLRWVEDFVELLGGIERGMGFTEGRPAQERLVCVHRGLDDGEGVAGDVVPGVLVGRARTRAAGGPTRDVLGLPLVPVQDVLRHGVLPGSMRNPRFVPGVHLGIFPVHVAEIEPSIAERLERVGDGHHAVVGHGPIRADAMGVDVSAGRQGVPGRGAYR